MTQHRILCLIAFCVIVWAAPGHSQSIEVDFGEGSLSGRVVQIFLLLTVLSLVPGLAVMITCFPFMITVLAILRQGLGLQQSPPNMLIVSLALFLTWFVMEPVFIDAWAQSVEPLLDGQIEIETAVDLGLSPFRDFMASRVDRSTLERLSEMRGTPIAAEVSVSSFPLSILIPSFLLSEIEIAFQVGYLIFLPFLVIDLVVAAILMSMGMMMVPPAIVSLPFKLAFFVVADGWVLVSEALVRGYL